MENSRFLSQKRLLGTSADRIRVREPADASLDPVQEQPDASVCGNRSLMGGRKGLSLGRGRGRCRSPDEGQAPLRPPPEPPAAALAHLEVPRKEVPTGGTNRRCPEPDRNQTGTPRGNHGVRELTGTPGPRGGLGGVQGG